MSQSTRQDASKYQKLIFHQKLYHPIIRVHQYIFSYLDVCSISKNIVMYPVLLSKNLLFKYSSFKMKEGAEAMKALNYLVRQFYNL